MDEWEAADLKENYMVVNSTTQTVQHGGGTLEILPGLVKKVIRNKCWRKMLWGDELIEYSSFEECVTADMPRGMGTTIQRLRDLCRSDSDAIKAIDGVLQRPAGAPVGNTNAVKDKETNVDNVNDCIERPTGNSREAGLRRLKKDRPDLYDAVGKSMTVNAAAVKAGFRVNPIQLNPTDPVKAVAQLNKALSEGRITREWWDNLCSNRPG